MLQRIGTDIAPQALIAHDAHRRRGPITRARRIRHISMIEIENDGGLHQITIRPISLLQTRTWMERVARLDRLKRGARDGMMNLRGVQPSAMRLGMMLMNGMHGIFHECSPIAAMAIPFVPQQI